MTVEEAIEEIKKLEYYGRPFDNSLEECNKASRKVMALNMAIKALEQEPKWIPVSERLPEKEGRYLTTILNEYDNRLRYIMTCDYFSNGCWCPDDECASSNVIAWMPLPPCFEPQESEDKE